MMVRFTGGVAGVGVCAATDATSIVAASMALTKRFMSLLKKKEIGFHPRQGSGFVWSARLYAAECGGPHQRERKRHADGGGVKDSRPERTREFEGAQRADDRQSEQREYVAALGRCRRELPEVLEVVRGGQRVHAHREPQPVEQVRLRVEDAQL